MRSRGSFKAFACAAMLGLGLAASAEAVNTTEDLQTWNFVVTPFGDGAYWLPQLAFFEKIGHVGDTAGIAMGPTDGVSIDLGRPEAPWQTVYASEYVANGQPGLTLSVPVGHCVLRFQSGLLVAVQGGSFFQPCALP